MMEFITRHWCPPYPPCSPTQHIVISRTLSVKRAQLMTHKVKKRDWFRCYAPLESSQSPGLPVTFTTAYKQHAHACAIMRFNNCTPVCLCWLCVLICSAAGMLNCERACLNLLDFSICCFIHLCGLNNCFTCLVAINWIQQLVLFFIPQCTEHAVLSL